jgi:hypothetical protein
MAEDSRMRDFSRQDQLDHEDEIDSRTFNRLQNRITRQRGSHVAGVDIERWLKPYQILSKNNLKPKETGDRFEYLMQVALKLKGTDAGFDNSTGMSNAYKIFNLDHSEQKLIAQLMRSAPKTSELEKYLKDSLDEAAQAKTDDNFRAYLAQRKADKGGRDAYQRDYDSSVSGMGRRERENDEGNTEPPNNFAVYINGKKWKVFKGRGQYADDAREQAHYQQLKDWAAKKSASTGKQWTVSITGETATESLDEVSWKGIKQGAAAAGLAGAMAFGAGGANARVTPDGQGGYTGGFKPTATVTAPSDNKPADTAPAATPTGFSKQYLQKAANPDRFGRYLISVEKAQELLKQMDSKVGEGSMFAGAKVGHKEGPAGQWRNDGAKKNKPARPGDLVGGGM